MNPILHIIWQENSQYFLLRSLLCKHVKRFPMLFPEVYSPKQQIKRLHFRRFNSPEKDSVKHQAPGFVPFMIYDCKSLYELFILQGISQDTGLDTAMNSTVNMAHVSQKNPGKPHTTFCFSPFSAIAPEHSWQGQNLLLQVISTHSSTSSALHSVVWGTYFLHCTSRRKKKIFAALRVTNH